MLETRLAVLIVAACCAAFLGCADSRPRANSSETHFLALCSDDDCGGGLSCVCGVCTEPCTGSGACSELASEAECVALDEASCEESTSVCDVECADDTDCAALSAMHGCAQGRCRAPDPGATPAPDPDAGTPAGGCEYNGATYADGEIFPDADGCNGCSCMDGEVACTARACSSTPLPCTGGSCESAGACYPDGASAIPDADGCNLCSCEAGVLSCREEVCDAPAPLDSPPCEAGSCDFYGTCYPPGETSEDGCCTCDESGSGDGSCIEPGWCPGRPPIGTRCGVDGDCSAGLECRTDFFGERGICTRSCNFGCPTGTECVASVPDYNGGTIANQCLRTCAAQADCEGEFGSECDMPGDLSRRYCF